jgi:hypothetical protein
MIIKTRGLNMKKLSIVRFIMVLLLPLCSYAQQHLATYFNFRSVSRDAARDLAGWTNYINKNHDRESVYGALSVTPEWTQTFDSKKITQSLFGNSLSCNGCGPYLNIAGSQVANRNEHALLADYFYLPPDFESNVYFNPSIHNFVTDIGWYLGLDPWKKGLYYFLHAPFAYTKWDLSMKEDIINPGVNGYSAGYFAPDTISRGTLLEQFTDFANGKTLPNINNIAFQELKYAQMSCKTLTKARLAEIRTGFGWNWRAKDYYHLGLNGQVAFPTGLRPKGNFLFEPMVGNSHFWELGFGLNGHYSFWENNDETKSCMFYVDANVTHLFNTRQARTFDLISAGPLSRYMLATEMTQPAVNLLGGGKVPSAQFDNDYLPVANATTLNVNVNIAVQADLVFMFTYTSGNMSYDIGYNYWGRTGENITLKPLESLAEQRYALKGDARMFGFVQSGTTAIPLSATNSYATIYKGTNGANNKTNNAIDFPQQATTNPPISIPPAPQIPLMYQPNSIASTDEINTSVPPVLITYSDIDVQAAGSHDSSSKIFGHIAYTAPQKSWTPYIGAGGYAEFNHSPSKNCKTNNCSSISGASQWGLWVKTGTTF